MLTIYHSHPFSGRTLSDIEKEANSFYSYFLASPNVQILEPLRGHLDDIPDLSLEWVEAHKKFSKNAIFPHTSRDFEDVKACDVVVVNLTGVERVSLGCAMEVAWAMAFDKPVFVLLPEGKTEDSLHIIVKQNTKVCRSFLDLTYQLSLLFPHLIYLNNFQSSRYDA